MDVGLVSAWGALNSCKGLILDHKVRRVLCKERSSVTGMSRINVALLREASSIKGKTVLPGPAASMVMESTDTTTTNKWRRLEGVMAL